MKKFLLFCMFAIPALSAVAGSNDTSRYYNYYAYDFVSPEEFTIRNILVEEADGKLIGKSMVIIYSGLSIGQRIKIPGNEIPKAIENLWKQNSFSDIQIFIKKIDSSDRIIVNIVLKEQPKLSGYAFRGVSNTEAKNLKDEVQLKGDMYITPNLANRTKNKLLNYYHEKGYYDADIKVKRSAYTKEGYEKFDINIKKGKKVKVYDFIFNGNEQLTDAELRKYIKKIKRRYNKINILGSSKFVESKFELEKENIIKKYQSKGFRDVRILSDSVVSIEPRRVNVYLNIFEGHKYYFREINWKGNLKFRTTLLDTLLGIKKGDVFNQTLLDERLFANPGGFDIQSLYMDDGYLFFSMVPVETGIFSDSIDMEIRITEGKQARIGSVKWTGNTKTADRVILREIRTKPGDIFSRAEIQRTMRDLITLGLFDPAEMNVNPVPNPANGTVDIEYILGEKPSDQIELSGGWGGNGFNNRPSLIGTAGVVLNNFSTRKLFSPKTWNPVPTGDGQKLSLRAQSNGSNYQGYTFSFTEPWFSGKRPNSLSIAVFRTVNSFDWRSKKDPLRSVFQNTGMTLSLGKRLKWPDDFFNIQYTLSLQQYNVNNLEGSFYGFPPGFEGISYNPSLQIILTRNSISDPIYPMTGSSFTLSTQATPPFSLLAKNLPKYMFAEFYKWKFDMEWYTTVWKKMVFTTKARFGFLGYYNPELGTTFFERFQVGGAGIFGFNIAATEIISQRGYDNYTISRTAMGKEAGAPIFNKFTAELRYALTTSQTATVYGLVFAEAGDAWSNLKKYNPFQLKRAVGIGVRLFMPMFGLIGLDFAYGFDYRQVPSSVKPGQIHFFIGQQF